MCVCVRVCVVIPFSLDVRLVGAAIGVTPDFSTFRLWCLPMFLSREPLSRPFPSLDIHMNNRYLYAVVITKMISKVKDILF